MTSMCGCHLHRRGCDWSMLVVVVAAVDIVVVDDGSDVVLHAVEAVAVDGGD